MQRSLMIFVMGFALAGASQAYAAASGGGGGMRPNSDIRALEPPIDVTDSQLQAQGTVIEPPAPTVGVGYLHGHHHHRHHMH